MRVTNVLGLPDSLVRLVSNGFREPREREISVTTLIRPPQMVALERQHWGELEEDASDRMWATYGTLIHRAIEGMGHDNALVEERLATEINGWTVHGTPDLYEADGTLTDFKFVSVWSVVGGVKPEWERQLNCYAYLLEQHGFPVTKLQIVALLRDWSKNRAHEDGYPSRQVLKLPVVRWSPGFAERFIAHRLLLADDDPCSPEERWEKPTQYAVTKKGNKRASRLLDTRDEAVEWALLNSKDGAPWERWFDIIERPGESIRCANYCAVSGFCSQWKSMSHEAEAVTA